MKFLKTISLIFTPCLVLSGCNLGSTYAEPKTSYEFIVDAGSSGSRIYIYSKYLSESGFIINNLYESKINIPLASFSANPREAGVDGVQPLLTSAINFMKTSKLGINNKTIFTSVLGTAGMRLIPESQQNEIYQSVASTVAKNNLQIGETKTISGQSEGIYSWADANYLKNIFNTNSKSNGILEIGGASAQITFATSQTPNESIIPVIINNKAYNVYSISFLGLGQDVSRYEMDQSHNHDTCYPEGFNNPLFNIAGKYNFNDCTANYNSVLNLYPEINNIQNIQGYSQESFIGLGSIYRALNFWNIESQPGLLTQYIKNDCTKKFSELINQHPNSYRPENQYANATFINDMLFNKLNINGKQLSVVEKINGVSLTWTLGYVLTQN